MSESVAPRPAAGHRRRARVAMAGGALAFAGLTAALFLARPRTEPYVPGREAEKGTEITRSLDRQPAPASTDAPRHGRPSPVAPPPPGAARPAARPGEVVFEDVAEAVGLGFRHFHGRRSTQLPEDMGSGLAWGDYAGDGDPDLFVVNESGPLTLSAP